QLSSRVGVDTPTTIDAQKGGRRIEERIEILREAVLPSAPGHHTALGGQFDRPGCPDQLIDERCQPGRGSEDDRTLPAGGRVAQEVVDPWGVEVVDATGPRREPGGARLQPGIHPRGGQQQAVVFTRSYRPREPDP